MKLAQLPKEPADHEQIQRWFAARMWRRVLGLTVIVGVSLAFSMGVVFTSAPLLIRSDMVAAGYPSGTQLGGISWTPDLIDLRVSIENPSKSEDYEDLDITVRPGFPDVYITAIGEISNAGVKFSETELQAWQDVNGVPQVKFDSSTGHTLHDAWKFATDEAGRLMSPRRVLPNHWRLHCDKLLHHTTIEIALAVAKTDIPSQGAIRDVWIKGQYRGRLRLRAVDRTVTVGHYAMPLK